MTTIDERVAYLEGKVDEHSHGFRELRDSIRELDQKLDRRVDALDQKLDRGLAELGHRIDQIEHKLGARIDGLDEKLSRQFLWIVGVQVAVLLAVVGALTA